MSFSTNKFDLLQTLVYRLAMGLTGVKFRVYPTSEQKCRLSRWMGCARWIYNAKCEEFEYFLRFKKKSASHVGYLIRPDQKYSQFRSESSKFLDQCPSQVLRNTCTQWYEAACRFFKKQGGKPKKKRKASRSSVTLTRELFRWEDGCLSIGTKKHPIGTLSINAHRSYEIPASVVISQDSGHWYISFCYESPSLVVTSEEEVLDELAKEDPQELPHKVLGLDRGVKIPLQVSDGRKFDFSEAQKKSIRHCEREIEHNQVRLSRQQKKDKDVPESQRRKKTKTRIGRLHRKIAHIRKDFAHKTTRALVGTDENPQEVRVFVLEDLKTKNMTKRAKPKEDPDQPGVYLPNGKAAKSGLNKSILSVAWGHISLFLSYKAKNSNKLCLKVDPRFSSQECASCGHTHPENRRSQSEFWCRSCGHHENADLNAAMVLKKRGLEVIFEKVTHGRWESARGKMPRKQSLRRTSVRSQVSENRGSAPKQASSREARSL